MEPGSAKKSALLLSHRTMLGLVALQVVVHLSASGGQVIANYAIGKGTNSWVLGLYTVAASATVLLLFNLNHDAAALQHGIGRLVREPRAAGLPVLGLGFNFTIKTISSFWAFSMVSALNAAVYVPLIPVFAAAIAWGLGWERLNGGRAFAGVGCAITGAIVVSVAQYAGESSSTSASEMLLGNLLLLVWTVTAANAIVLQRPLLRAGFPPVVLAAIVLSVAAMLLAIVVTPKVLLEATAAGGGASAFRLSELGWDAVFYCVYYYCLVNWADAFMVTLIPTALVALGLTLEPFFTAGLEAAIFGDTMTAGEYVGAGLTIVGLVLVISSYGLEDRHAGSRSGNGDGDDPEQGTDTRLLPGK